MIDMAKLEARADKAARRTGNNIPQGWWKGMFRAAELTALLATNRWTLTRVTGQVKLPGVRATRMTQVILRKVK